MTLSIISACRINKSRHAQGTGTGTDRFGYYFATYHNGHTIVISALVDVAFLATIVDEKSRQLQLLMKLP